MKFYNLDIIISVGYRVKSIQGTRFRQWATERLNEYIVKGFTMDDERLKNLGGGNYWKELLDRLPAKDIFSFIRMYFKDKTKSVKFCEICGTFMGVQDMTSGTPTSL